MENDAYRKILLEIADLLAAGHEDFYAYAVRDAASGSEEKLNKFLVSNELWGGPGSLADSAFCSKSNDPLVRYSPNDPDELERKKNSAAFQDLMIELGQAQITAKQVNVRTNMWVEAFEDWRDKGFR